MAHRSENDILRNTSRQGNYVFNSDYVTPTAHVSFGCFVFVVRLLQEQEFTSRAELRTRTAGFGNFSAISLVTFSSVDRTLR